MARFLNFADDFDPEGEGYDEKLGALLNNMWPLTIPKPKKYQGDYVQNEGAYSGWVWHPEANDYKKHGSSLDPRTGMVLKGRKHPTWDLMEQEEERLGSKIIKGPNGRYYAVPKDKVFGFLQNFNRKQ
jgi:hypothetical protein